MSAVVRWLEHFLVLPFLGIRMKIDIFQSCGNCWVFQICWHIECSTWKESYDQPRWHIVKQRHYFVNKGPSSQGYGFSSGHVWMWELDCYERWVWRIDAFELWCWRRLRVPWTNQSILKEISPGYSLEGLMLKLKLQYFGHPMQRTDSLEKTLMLGKIEGRRRRGRRGWDGWMASPTQWTWVCVSSGSWWWTGKPGMLPSMRLQRVRHNWVTEQQQPSVCCCCFMRLDSFYPLKV